MGIIRSHVMHFVTLHPLIANPNIGLNVFHQMANVNLPIGIGQGRGN